MHLADARFNRRSFLLQLSALGVASAMPAALAAQAESALDAPMYRRILRAHLRSIVAASPVLELGEPEYCVFPDMLRFEPKTLLACT